MGSEKGWLMGALHTASQRATALGMGKGTDEGMVV
jgi:hypothetical protein